MITFRNRWGHRGRAGRPPIAPERIELVATLARMGETDAQIATELDLSLHQVRKWRYRAGIRYPACGRGKALSHVASAGA